MTTETTTRDGAAVRIPPPLVFLACILLGLALERYVFFPGTWPRSPLSLAAAVGGLGVFFLLASFKHFQRTQQDPKPWKPTPELIGEGMYRYTRNPMYLGLGLLQVAVGIALGNAWVVVGVGVSWIVVYLTAIRHEETYLESKFGDSYRTYKAAVPRWLGLPQS